MKEEIYSILELWKIIDNKNNEILELQTELKKEIDLKLNEFTNAKKWQEETLKLREENDKEIQRLNTIITEMGND